MAYPNKVIVNKHLGQQIRFVRTSKETRGEYLQLESTYPSASAEPAPHYHPYQDEEFEVLEGCLQVRVNGVNRELKAGEKLFIPRHTVHSMWNAAHQKTVVSWKVVPALETEYFLETAVGLVTNGKAKSKGRLPLLQAVLLARRFASEYRLAKPSYRAQRILSGILAPFAYLVGYRPVYKKFID